MGHAGEVHRPHARALRDYLVAHNPPPDVVLRDLAAETAALGPISRMQITVEQGALLTRGALRLRRWSPRGAPTAGDAAPPCTYVPLQ